MKQTRQHLTLLLAKLFAFIVLLYVTLYLSGQACIRVVQKQTHRNQLFYTRDFSHYPIILLGDSVVTSRYTDSEAQALWTKISVYSGLRTFPGGLDGAKVLDIHAAATYIANKISSNTIVIIDITPGQKFRTADQNYQSSFYRLIGYHSTSNSPLESAWNNFVHPLLYCIPFYGSPNLAEITLKDLSKKYQLNDEPKYFNRIWNQGDIDFAYNRYRAVLTTFDPNNYLPPETFHVSKLVEALAPKTRKILFVFTPLNRELIRTLSKLPVAESFIAHLEQDKNTIEQFLKVNNLAYVDTFNSVPSDGFADLMHTNALGDDIVGRKISEFVLSPSSAWK